MEETETASEVIPPAKHRFKFNPWLFFGVLLAPGLISIVVSVFNNRNYGEAAVNTWAVASVIAGLICGAHFALALKSLQTPLRIVIGIISVIGCTVAAAWLGMAGCSLFIKMTQ